MHSRGPRLRWWGRLASTETGKVVGRATRTFLTRNPADCPKYSAWWWWDKAVSCRKEFVLTADQILPDVEAQVVFTVFGITGSTTAFLVRPLVTDYLGLKGESESLGPRFSRGIQLISKSIACRIIQGRAVVLSNRLSHCDDTMVRNQLAPLENKSS